jgi:hypothetical protein
MRTRSLALLTVALLLTWVLPAQALRIGVAPFAGSGLTMDQARVARSLFIHDLQKEMPKSLVVELRADSWMALSPVLELLGEARGEKLDRVVLVSADQLGDKLIMQLRVLQVSDESSLFTDSMPLSGVEDLDTAMQRAAMAVARGKSLDEVREVGQVLENEGLKTRHREALRQTTLQAGYLWPLSDDNLDKSKRNYDGHARRFTFAISNGIEDRQFDAGYTLAWRYGFAAQLYSDWLFRTQDICPYLGAALGFHWALDKNTGASDYGVDDGFHLAARSGIILFRTYDFQMSLEGSYLVTWNDDVDRAWMLSLGLRP